MLINTRPGINQTGINQTDKKRPAFMRHPLRCTLALIADGWMRLEHRWEDNPGFVAMTAAGSLGLLLTAAMLINAGLGWLQDDMPTGDDVAAESPDAVDSGVGEPNNTEPELGDASGDEIFVVRGRKQKVYRDSDDSGDESDPFVESKTPARPIVSRFDDDVMDDDDATEPTKPVQVAKTRTPPQIQNPFDDDDATEETTDRSTPEPEKESVKIPAKEIAALPVQKPDTLDDDDAPAEADEPEVKRPLPEMRVATQPEVLQSLDADDAEGSSSADADQLAEQESKSSLKEPARLKRIEAEERIDDESPKPDRSINLVRAPAENPAPRDDRWKQQQTKVAPENAAPAVAARQSRPVETKIFAPQKARPVQSSPVQSSTVQSSPVQASSVPVAKASPPSRDSSAAPLLRLAISGPPSVGIGQPCQIEIRVTNTGSVPARRLVVSAELPEGLVHDVAQSLEQQIETLAPGATYRALLRVRGAAVGEKTIQAVVESADRAALQLSAKVRVTPASAASTTIGAADCFCAPLVR